MSTPPPNDQLQALCNEAIALSEELKQDKADIQKLKEERDIKGKTERVKQLLADIAEEHPDLFEHQGHLFGKTSKKKTVYAKKTVTEYLDDEGHEDFVQRYTQTVNTPICVPVKKKRKR